LGPATVFGRDGAFETLEIEEGRGSWAKARVCTWNGLIEKKGGRGGDEKREKQRREKGV